MGPNFEEEIIPRNIPNWKYQYSQHEKWDWAANLWVFGDQEDDLVLPKNRIHPNSPPESIFWNKTAEIQRRTRHGRQNNA